MPELLYLDVGNVVLPNNYFPDNAISSHEKLEAVILPVSLDSIWASAFGGYRKYRYNLEILLRII